MTVAVVTKEEHDAALARLAALERRLALVEQGGGAAGRAREYLTPKQVARSFGVGHDVVYAALDSGRLAAEPRPGGKHGRLWRIQPDAARAWYQAFVAKGSNQGGQS